MAKIELIELAHTYDRSGKAADYALHTLNLTWEDGGTYALLGPSGCGKSTMLNIVSGLLTPSKGRVLIDGVDVTGVDAVRRNIAQVFQFPVVYRAKTVYENLAFPLRCRKTPKKLLDERVREVAALLNLEAILDQPAYKVTPDAKQLISLGRGLVRDDVAVILMDEPLTVIDPQLKFQLRRKLKEISARYGHTLVYVTHDQNEAMTLAEQVIVMDNGRIVQVGTPQELFENPSHTHIGYFIGSPSMNFLPCSLRDGRVVVFGKALNIRCDSNVAAAKQLLLGIRPEFLGLSEAAGPNTVESEIADVQDLGGFAIVTAVAGGESLKLKLRRDMPQIGDRTNVVLPEKWVRVYADGRRVTCR